MNENEIIVISSDEESTISEPLRKNNAGADKSSGTIIRTYDKNVNLNSLNIQEKANSCNIRHKIGNVHFNITISNSEFENLKSSKITETEPLKITPLGEEFEKAEVPPEQETEKIANEICSKRELCESDNSNKPINNVVEPKPIKNKSLTHDNVSKEKTESAVASNTKKKVKIVPVDSHNSDRHENNNILPCCSKSLHRSSKINKKVNELITNKSNQATDKHVHLQENLKDNEVEKNKLSCLFKKFLDVVLSVEKNESDRTKLRSKLIKYHNLSDPNFLKSPKFKETLEKYIAKTKANPTAAYFIIKEVLDMFLKKRTLKKKSIRKQRSCSDNSQCKEDKDPEEDVYFDGNDINHKIIKKLTKRLEQLGSRIKELEEEEVDFNEEENSNYLKMQRYRERFSQIYVKLCKYTNKTSDANRIYRRKIHYSGTKFPALNDNIEKWLNEIKIFPDFSDVLKFTEEQNTELSLKLPKEQIQTLAVDIFSDVGNMLQRLRRQDLWDSFSSYLGDDIDPALKNPELNDMLRNSYKLGLQKERELINYYAEKQEREHLQPVEVPDEIANLSPESSEEDIKEMEESGELSNNFRKSESMTNVETSNVESTTQDNLLLPDSKTSEDNSENTEIEAEKTNTNEISDVPLSSAKPEISSTTIARPDSARNNKSYLVSLSLNNVIALLNNVKNNDKLNEDETLDFAERFKFANSNDDDSESDCEVTEIVSVNKKSECEKKPLDIQQRRFHQINYAFVNKCFSHNTILCSEDISRKKNNYWFNFRIEKISGSFPFADLTNSKNASEINLSFSGIDEDGKGSIHNIKSRYLNKQRRFQNYDFKLPSFDKMDNQCVPQKGAKKRKTNVSIQRSGAKHESSNSKKNSNDETAKLQTREGSGGENGEDSNNNNENIKPLDRNEIVEHEKDLIDEDCEEQENDKSITVIDDEIGVENSMSQDMADNGQHPSKVTKSQKSKLSDTLLNCKALPNLSQNGTTGVKSLYNFLNIDFENDNFSLLPEIKALIESTLIDETEMNTTATATGMQESSQKSEATAKDIISASANDDVGKDSTSVNAETPKSDVKARNPEESRNESLKDETLRIISDCDIEIISDYEKCSKAVKRKFPESARDCDEELSDIAIKKQAKSKSKAMSDDEIIRNFLKNSPSSLSIKKPKKTQDTTSKIVQALATLSRLKNISTTIIKTSAKTKNEEDISIVGESLNDKTPKSLDNSSLPNSDAEKKENFTVPKIVTVRGNVSDFEKISNESINHVPFGQNSNSNEETRTQPWQQDTWNAQDNFQSDFGDNADTPMKNTNQHSRFRIIKGASNQEEIKKKVEYVVID